MASVLNAVSIDFENDDLVRPPALMSTAAILQSKKGPYTVVDDWPRPSIAPNEVLVKTHAIGLNPIDWKCVTFGFGVHSIPWVSGREAAGIVVQVGADVLSVRKGDRVVVTSTNYRDIRTSTFQEVRWRQQDRLGSLAKLIGPMPVCRRLPLQRLPHS